MDVFVEELKLLCDNCPDGSIRVVRVAMVDSFKRRPRFHGPGWGNLPNPQQDSPRHTIRKHERCGTLPHQFRLWWPMPGTVCREYGFEYDPGMRVYVLEVPRSACVVQGMQVVFDPAHARVVYVFNPH